MATKKRLIFHLGLPRTGTTSIQKFLRRNDAALKDLGIWYPNINPERYVKLNGPQDDLRKKTILTNLSRGVYHVILAMAVGDSAQIAGQRGFEISLDVWKDFLDEFERGDCHVAIISFEGFGAAPHSHNLDRLRNALSRFDCEGIIYHRNYDSWLKSLFEQYVRGMGRYSNDFDKLLNQAQAKLYPFTHRIEAIKTSLLLDNIVVRSFENAARNDTLLPDFFAALGLQEAWARLGPADRKRANAAFLPSQTLVLHQLNRWGVADGAFVEVRAAFGRTRKKTKADDPYSIIPADTLDRLRAMAAAEAEELRSQFGIEPAPRPPPGPPLPHHLGRERFREMIETIADTISPRTRDELLRRSAELEP